MSDNQIKVGIGVFVFKDGKFLMGRRKGSHDSGTWSIPGGHVEFGESFKQTALREVKEETNLEIKNIRFAAVTNDFFEQENKQYVSVILTSEYSRGAVNINEPDKLVELNWFDFDTLPQPLFASWKQLLVSEFIEEIRRRCKVTA